MILHSHGGIRSVVEEVIRDMGFRENELDIEPMVKVIGALLGDDGMEILESTIRDREETRLRDIIEYELEEEIYD